MNVTQADIDKCGFIYELRIPRTINAYIPELTALMFETEDGQKTTSALIEFGGWNHHDKSLTPIHVKALLAMPHNPALYWVMDSLAAAAEAGRLDADKYMEQLFASSDARAFRLALRDAGADEWINDRLHNALHKRLRKYGCNEPFCDSVAL